MATKKKAVKDAVNDELEIKGNVADMPEDEEQKQDEIVDVDLSALRKKRFRIDGDDNRILYLDTSDFSLIGRIEKAMPKLQGLIKSVFAERAKDEEENDEADQKLLEEIDAKMRELLDSIFDSNVSAVCAPSGYMFDLFNGELRFEHILQTLTKLYEKNIEREYRLLSRKISSYTAKYTGGKK